MEMEMQRTSQPSHSSRCILSSHQAVFRYGRKRQSRAYRLLGATLFSVFPNLRAAFSEHEECLGANLLCHTSRLGGQSKYHPPLPLHDRSGIEFGGRGKTFCVPRLMSLDSVSVSYPNRPNALHGQGAVCANLHHPPHHDNVMHPYRP